MAAEIDGAPHFSLHGKSASASKALAALGRIAWNPRVFSLLSVLLNRGDGDNGGGSEGGTLRGRGDERSRACHGGKRPPRPLVVPPCNYLH